MTPEGIIPFINSMFHTRELRKDLVLPPMTQVQAETFDMAIRAFGKKNGWTIELEQKEKPSKGIMQLIEEQGGGIRWPEDRPNIEGVKQFFESIMTNNKHR